MKKVCVVSVSRADYGLLKWVIKEVSDSPELELQLVASGTHFSSSHGNTFLEIQEDGFAIAAEVPIIPERTSELEITRALGQGLSQFGATFNQLKPDIVVLLGDRSETVVAAIAATVAGSTILHIHGGEITEGAIDDAFRHAITKMAHLHFVARNEDRERVVQMGENPENVFVVGPMAYESILRLELFTREEIENRLEVSFGERNILVTLHPETLVPKNNIPLLRSLIATITELVEAQVFVTASNTDAHGDDFNSALRQLSNSSKNVWFFDSLGSHMYLSLMAQVDAVVGNSSSGIYEAPALGVPTVNIGDRQFGRSSTPTIFHVPADPVRILEAIWRAFVISSAGKEGDLPRGQKEELASRKIIHEVTVRDLPKLRRKVFRAR